MSLSLQLEDRRVDLDTGRISTGGELRPMELRLLRYLLQRPEEVVSHDELLVNVWGYAASVRSRTIYSTLHRLRQALEIDPKAPRYIVTLAGEGVQLKGLARTLPLLPQTNLTPTPEPLIGRDVELSWLLACSARLVTILGAGGVGKTRLAWEYAHRETERNDGPNAVWFCRLDDLSTIDDLLLRVAHVIHIKSDDPRNDIVEELAARGPITLVLDNAESIEGPLGEMLVAWLTRAPLLRLIVTSREPLRVSAEQRLPLEPLRGTVARDLLLARIKHIDPLFDPSTKDNDCALNSLLSLLDGLPLAIEIVAPHVATLGAAIVYDRLIEHSSLPHLRHDVPQRHQSLAEVVAWSIERLPSASLSVLRQLAVFRCWFSLEQAQQVVLSEQTDITETILDLLERGLVYRVPHAKRPRFALYATVKAYVGHPPPAVVERYVSSMALWVASLYNTNDGFTPRESEFIDDADEIISAASLCASHGGGAPIELLVDLALRSAIRTGRDGLALADRLLCGPCTERVRARTLLWKAARLATLGRLEESFSVSQGAIALAAREGLHQAVVEAEQYRAGLLFNNGDRIAACAALDRAKRNLDDSTISVRSRERLLGAALTMRAFHGGSTAEKIALLREAIVLLSLHEDRHLSTARHNLAAILAAEEQHEEAEALLLVSLAEPVTHSHQARIHTLCQLARVRRSMGRLDEAGQSLHEAAEIADRYVIHGMRARVSFEQSTLEEELGHLATASTLAERSIRDAMAFGPKRIAIMARTASARLAIKRGMAVPVGLRGLLQDALSQQMWASSTQLLSIHICLSLSGRGIDEFGESPLSLASRIQEALGESTPEPWLIRLELLRMEGRDLEGIHGLQAVAANCLPRRAHRVLLARAAALAEHGDPRDAIALLERSPPPTHPWEHIYHARCCQASGLPVRAISGDDIDPFDILLVRARMEAIQRSTGA